MESSGFRHHCGNCEWDFRSDQDLIKHELEEHQVWSLMHVSIDTFLSTCQISMTYPTTNVLGHWDVCIQYIVYYTHHILYKSLLYIPKILGKAKMSHLKVEQKPDASMNLPDKHQTCGLDGCSFTAAAKPLEIHILHMHSSGLYNRVHQGNTPEDVAKWRAERKK